MGSYYLGIDLFSLAYIYLMKKKRITHKQYTWGDLFFVCEKILQWSENTGGKSKKPKLRFSKEAIEIDEKLAQKIWSANAMQSII